MTLRELSRETRRKPIEGGTWICSRCDKDRLPTSAYCREHRNEYQRLYRAERLRELKQKMDRLKSLEVLLEEAHTDH